MTPPSSRDYNNNNNNNSNNNNRHPSNRRDLGGGGDDGYTPRPAASYGTGTSFEPQESVEERLASWRAQQQERYETQNPVDELNPRDEEGRLKLLATVSRGSISVFFFVLMWRSVHHFELADQAFRTSPTLRLLLVVPTIRLFIGNMAGCVSSISGGRTLKGKKRMKAILNLNKLVELGLFLYNVVRLALVGNRLVPREVYVGRTLTNFMFIVQCQLFTRVTWDAAQVTQGSTVPTGERTTTSSSHGYGGTNDNDGGYLRNDDRFDYDIDNDGRYAEHQQQQQRESPPYGADDDLNDDWDDGRRQRWDN